MEIFVLREGVTFGVQERGSSIVDDDTGTEVDTDGHGRTCAQRSRNREALLEPQRTVCKPFFDGFVTLSEGNIPRGAGAPRSNGEGITTARNVERLDACSRGSCGYLDALRPERDGKGERRILRRDPDSVASRTELVCRTACGLLVEIVLNKRGKSIHVERGLRRTRVAGRVPLSFRRGRAPDGESGGNRQRSNDTHNIRLHAGPPTRIRTPDP